MPDPTPAEYPATEKRRVSDEYHGVKIGDDYRSLEEAGTPPVKAWTEAQNATRALTSMRSRIARASRRGSRSFMEKTRRHTADSCRVRGGFLR